MQHSSVEVWGFTPDSWSPKATFEAIVRVFDAGVDRIVVRERRLEVDQQHALVAALLAHGLASDRVLLRIGPDDPAPPQGWAVHLADGVVRPLGERPLVSAAVHSLAGLREDVDMLLVSPFASPRSKRTTGPVLGAAGLRRFVEVAHRPVLALGGMTPQNARLALGAGAAGVAAISSIFMDGENSLLQMVRTVHR